MRNILLGLIVSIAILNGGFKDKKIDDWDYNATKIQMKRYKSFNSSPVVAPSPIMAIGTGGDIAPVMMETTVSRSTFKAKKIGFSVGGAKDTNNFYDNIKNAYLPKLSSITYEGQFYNHYFDTGIKKRCKGLFCPSYSKAIAKNIYTQDKEYFLTVGLNSGIKESDFKRKKLNIVVVLDISGSMGSSFDRYYYDSKGNQKRSDSSKSKMQIANRAVVDMIGHLKGDDRLGVILFDDRAYKAKPLRKIKYTNITATKKHILNIKDKGGTNWSNGYQKALNLFKTIKLRKDYENRIIFITDAMPNHGELSKNGLFGLAKKASKKGIYTSFIGVGVDFNTDLVEYVSKTKGANYFSVHSSKEFSKRLNREFDYMVTPMVFDLKLDFKSRGYKIVDIYGSPVANKKTGSIINIGTLFPSATNNQKVKGGVVLLKLKKIGESKDITLSVSYKNRDGKRYKNSQRIRFSNNLGYDNNGIEKAILISNFVSLMKNWLIDSRALCNNKPIYSYNYFNPISETKNFRYIKSWEQKSCKLRLTNGYAKLLNIFKREFKKEMDIINDRSLNKELEILEEIISKNRDSIDKILNQKQDDWLY
jgi:Ca-activated chloride channel family protein